MARIAGRAQHRDVDEPHGGRGVRRPDQTKLGLNVAGEVGEHAGLSELDDLHDGGCVGGSTKARNCQSPL